MLVYILQQRKSQSESVQPIKNALISRFAHVRQAPLVIVVVNVRHRRQFHIAWAIMTTVMLRRLAYVRQAPLVIVVVNAHQGHRQFHIARAMMTTVVFLTIVDALPKTPLVIVVLVNALHTSRRQLNPARAIMTTVMLQRLAYARQAPNVLVLVNVSRQIVNAVNYVRMGFAHVRKAKVVNFLVVFVSSQKSTQTVVLARPHVRQTHLYVLV